MGLFDRFKKKDSGRFVPEDEYRRNLASQKTMTPKTMDQLRKLGVGPERRLKVELFFYSNTLAKAEALAQTLRAMNYEVDALPTAKGVEFLTTGWTTPISMTDSDMLEWTERMCEIGYQHDCEFDGWGTTPDQ